MIDKITLFGTSVSLYYLFWFIAFLVCFLIGCRTGKQYGFSLSKRVLYLTGHAALGTILLWVTSLLSDGEDRYIRMVYFRYIMMYLQAYIMKDSPDIITDYLGTLEGIFFGVSHFGCVFAGCCHGYPAEWGLYSNIAQTVCFPIQLVEAISSILIGMLLLYFQKRGIQRGKLYAWFLVLFGGTRIIWECFRDNEKIWAGMSNLTIHAIIAVLVGLAVIALKSVKRSGGNEES